MNNRLRLAVLVLATIAAAGARAASDAVGAPGGASGPAVGLVPDARVRDHAHADAIAGCETAVDHSIHEIRGRQVSDLQFSGEGHEIVEDGDHVGVRGTGHYRRGSARRLRSTTAAPSTRGRARLPACSSTRP